MFYYTIANIRPEYRSRLPAIQLLAIATTRDIKAENSEKRLLGDFIKTVNRLQTSGVKMLLHGDNRVI